MWVIPKHFPKTGRTIAINYVFVEGKVLRTLSGIQRPLALRQKYNGQVANAWIPQMRLLLLSLYCRFRSEVRNECRENVGFVITIYDPYRIRKEKDEKLYNGFLGASFT